MYGFNQQPMIQPLASQPVMLGNAPIMPTNQPPMTQQVPQTGLIGAEQAMNQGQMGAEQLLLGGSAVGNQANNMQAAISGALGGQAQSQAYQMLGNSPATKYQMDQMQRSVERSAAARGGLLSGNTLRALQENAAGIASQDYQNQVNTLGQVADRGASFTGLLANLRSNLGMEKAAGRTRAGEIMAQNAQTTASGLAELLDKQGVNVSQNMSGYINTVANMLHDYGMQDSVDASSLAQILANISGGQASNLQQGYQSIGDANAARYLGYGNTATNAINQSIMLGAFNRNSTTPTMNTNGSYTGQNYAANIA